MYMTQSRSASGSSGKSGFPGSFSFESLVYKPNRPWFLEIFHVLLAVLKIAVNRALE